MADADVPITAGTGTKIDTRTVGAGTDEHRQVVVVGDPATAANVAGVTAAGAMKVEATFPAVPQINESQAQTAGAALTWTSATALNTANAVACTNYGTANVSIRVPTTTTAGVISLEVSDDGGTTYYPAGAVRVDNGLQENVISLAYAPGINGNRVWTMSVDAFTHVRARLSTVIAGAGNVVVTVSLVGGGIEPFVAQRSRKSPTYRAVYRAAARVYNLSNAFGAAGRKQYATIHHAATAAKTVRLRRVIVEIIDNTAAAQISVDLVRITAAPATGNPAVTPVLADSGDPAVEATCLALPTTAGTEATSVYATQRYNLPISAASATAVPHVPMYRVDLLAAAGGTGFDDEVKSPTIRAGVLEGWAVTLDVNVATTTTAVVEIEFTEEPA